MPDSVPLKPIDPVPGGRSGDSGREQRHTLWLVPGDGKALGAGWYRLHGRVIAGDGAIPALRTADDARTDDLDVLPLTASGEVEAGFVFRLPASIARLAVIDALGGAIPATGLTLSVVPVGRREALWAMLSTLSSAAEGPRWRRLCAALPASLAAAARGGGPAAAHALHGYYRQALCERQYRHATRSRDRVGIRLRRRSAVAGPAARADMLVVEPPPAALMVAGAGFPAPMSRLVLPPVGLGRPLAPGWYRFRTRLWVLEGKLVGPRLYPDYGHGPGEGAVIHLGEAAADGTLDVLLVLAQPTCALRFDPSLRRVLFKTEYLRLERLGRPSAFAYMLRRVRGDSPGNILATFLHDGVRKGISRATDGLFSRYRESAIRDLASYAHWVERYDSFLPEDIEALHAKSALLEHGLLEHGPTISVLVPVYQTPEAWLYRCLDSVLEQAYPKWELCIANDASPAPHVRRVLDEYAARDPRIKVVHRESNGHISAASNSALALCTGDYVGLLDHDDELRPHALLEMAEAIVRDPGLKVLYSDEDKVDENGKRFDPYFKPDWNPDLMRGQNYLCHFSVIEAGLLREVGGFREGYEGSQDHDLLLRCTERIAPGQIHHVPKVLYHWRAIEGSTALVRDAKDYASVAGARAVRDHLQRIGANASLEELPHGHYRVRWATGARAPKVSLVIPTRDRVELLRMCVQSVLERTRYPDYEIIVVDNQSVERETLVYFDQLAGMARVRVLRYDAPFNYSAINNWAVAQSDGEIVGLLNNDIEVITPEWLQEMASQASRPEVGAVGAMLYYPDDTIQHAGVVLGVHGVAAHMYAGMPRGCPGHGGRVKVVQELSAVTGACLLVRREAYDQVGGLDERLQVAFNDIDFCLRLRAAGYRNIWTPFAELYHHESASRGSEDTAEKKQRFAGEVDLMMQRWGDALLRDPAYNVNLSLSSHSSELSAPPRH